MGKHEAKRVIIIGSGIGGLATACLLARGGHKVTVLEKNSDLGGRAGQLKEKGFTFTRGPSWYLMPEVFERFYDSLGEKVSEHLDLQKLSPSFRVFYKNSLLGATDIHSEPDRDQATFELFEPEGEEKLQRYLFDVQKRYEIIKKSFLYKNYSSSTDLLKENSWTELKKLNLLSSWHHDIAKYFSNGQLQKILEFPAMFLGTSPFSAPAAYSMLNHATLNQGVFYPKGGFYSLVESLINIGKKNGVEYVPNSEVTKIISRNQRASGVLASGKNWPADIVISGAGLHHTELNLLREEDRSYSRRFFRRKKTSPSAVLIYLGVDGKLPELAHHNLIFTPEWKRQFDKLSHSRRLPESPSFYVCNASSNDPSLAPKGKHSLYAVVPVAKKIPATKADLGSFSQSIVDSIAITARIPDLSERIVYKKIFTADDFKDRYNAQNGTMLGLGHNFLQTGPFRPQNVSKKLNNLYYVGADTVPGVGVPMCLISAELVTGRILND